MFKAIDCIRIYVPDLEEALAFYRDRLGQALVWRSQTQAGLRLPGSQAELVLQTEREGLEVDLLVSSADEAAAEFVRAGGTLVEPPFDIQVGRCAVVRDPWGSELVLLDLSKGRLATGPDGTILGNLPPEGGG
jgi:lactoylglutathione lyase